MEMAYRILLPCKPLQPYIERYWLYDNRRAAGGEMIQRKRMPDGMASLIINIENFSWTNRAGQWIKSGGALLQGICSQAYLLRAEKNTLSFGVIFKPEAAGMLFGLPIGRLADNSAELENVLRQPEKVWIEQIRNAAHDAERVRIADDFFMRQLQQSQFTHPYLNNALSLIRQSSGDLRVEQLSRQLFVGRRQLERQFKEYIGLSPKMMLRIERFRRALHLARNNTARGTLTHIAHSCGYADQAHFIRESWELAGGAPTQLFDPTGQQDLVILF